MFFMISFKNLQYFLAISFFAFSSFTFFSEGSINITNPSKEDVIGYKYNLWAVQANSPESGSTYSFTGRIFLDRRKEYKAAFKKDEHAFLFQHTFKNGEIHHIKGNQIFTEVIKYSEISDYYIALKFGQEWVHHTFDDIFRVQSKKVGNDVGCETCNFTKVIYSSEDDWTLKLYYEIRPVYKEGIESPALVTEIEQQKTMHEATQMVQLSTDTKDAPMNLKVLSANNMTTYHVVIPDKESTEENYAKLKDVGPVYIETFDDSSRIRYLIGNATSYKRVKEIARQVEDLGFQNCKIAKCKSGVIKSYYSND